MPEVIEAPVKEETTVRDPKFANFLETLKKPLDETPKNFACVLHNDDTTHAHMVVIYLAEAYDMPKQRAMDIMFAVNGGDRGVICILPEKEARERTDKAIAMARADGFTEFSITVEEEK